MSVDFAFLDSGTGGLPYMVHLMKNYPSFSCVYLGDTAFFPYGEKTIDEIKEKATNAVQLLIDSFDPAAIVVACNTMSVTALEDLRRTFPKIAFIGTVPAIKLAVKVSENKRIGLLATRSAVESPYTQELITDFASDSVVIKRADPELISFVEKELYTATEEQIEKAIRPALDFFDSQAVDTIILGCTHFLHLKEKFQQYAKKNVKIVDSREGVVKQAIRVWAQIHGISVEDTIAMDKEKMSPKRSGALYITGFDLNTPTEEYEEIAHRLNLPFGGLLIV
jgi:glutamate racemase